MTAIVGTIIRTKTINTIGVQIQRKRVANGAVCKGLRNYAGGYGWRYREEVMKCSR